uniref:Laccase n=1 Tax=Aegilops tauschii TaxID=37682 RepID=N1QUV9_AEGTA
MGIAKIPAVIWLLGVVLALRVSVSPAEGAKTRHHDFFIKESNYTRLCKERTVLTVNGQFPGPTIYARKGDLVIVNVYNQGDKNITIHWNGVDQPRNPWSDGPEYITQCPIRPGGNFTYRVILSEEDGEWWNADVNHLLEEAERIGSEINISDANTINGQPGDLFPCSKAGTYKIPVQHGKTYLLRIINAGLSNDSRFPSPPAPMAAGTTWPRGRSRPTPTSSKDHPVDVPRQVDEHMLVTIAVNVLPCAPNETCGGPDGNRQAASLNNVSFVNPSVDILGAYYRSVRGVFDADFPNKPPFFFNFTDVDNDPVERWATKRGTKVKVVEYGAVVEVVFQDTSILGAENHPMHLHGFTFYVVGRGFGNFDEQKDPATYNLVDPPHQNTVSVPKAGWAAIRFRAANSGVWFMHCHFDRHVVWGMSTVFIVKDGKAPKAKMMPPPPNMPTC